MYVRGYLQGSENGRVVTIASSTAFKMSTKHYTIDVVKIINGYFIYSANTYTILVH